MQFGNKIVALLGRRGVGKSNHAISFLYYYYQQGRTIYSNIWLSFPYKKLELEMIKTLPEELNDSVIFIDEIHMWADAYKFFSKNSRSLSTLATQLRKRNITLIFTTQFLTQTVKRLRDQVDYLLLLEKYKPYDPSYNGWAKVVVLDATAPSGRDYLDEYIFDGRAYFNMYNTNEIVLDEN
ncbi:MAG: ATP-binding protein [Sulfolobaceae archaeon]